MPFDVRVERVSGRERGVAQLAFQIANAAVRFHVILQRRFRFHLLAAQVAHEIALVGVHRVAVRDLLRLVRKALFAVLALIRQRIVVRRVFVQMLFQFEIGFKSLAA